eukprot:8734658-Pyramimonas_sp.AAC.1
MGLPSFSVDSGIHPRQVLRGKIRIILSFPTPWGKPAWVALKTDGVRHVALPLGIPAQDNSADQMLWIPANGPDE